MCAAGHFLPFPSPATAACSSSNLVASWAWERGRRRKLAVVLSNISQSKIIYLARLSKELGHDDYMIMITITLHDYYRDYKEEAKGHITEHFAVLEYMIGKAFVGVWVMDGGRR